MTQDFFSFFLLCQFFLTLVICIRYTLIIIIHRRYIIHFHSDSSGGFQCFNIFFPLNCDIDSINSYFSYFTNPKIVPYITKIDKKKLNIFKLWPNRVHRKRSFIFFVGAFFFEIEKKRC